MAVMEEMGCVCVHILVAMRAGTERWVYVSVGGQVYVYVLLGGV